MPFWHALPHWAQQGKDIINLGIGQPDFRTPDHIVEAAIKALRDGHHGYTPANGLLATPRGGRPPHAGHDGRGGFSPDEVMIMPGGKPTMFAAILMFGEARHPDPLSGPRFPHLPIDDRNSPAQNRSLCRFARKTAFAFSAEETLSLITPQTRLLILNSPANPTGGVTPRAGIEKLVKALEDHPHVAGPFGRNLRRHDL